MVDGKKFLMVSAGVGLISYGLAWAYQKFVPGGIANIAFSVVDINVGKQISSGLDTSLAGMVLSNFGMTGTSLWQQLIIILLTAMAVIFVGNLTNNQFGPIGRSENSRFAFDMLFGSLAIGLVIGYMSKGTFAFSFGVAIALGLYFLIVAAVYNLVKTYVVKSLPTP